MVPPIHFEMSNSKKKRKWKFKQQQNQNHIWNKSKMWQVSISEMKFVERIKHSTCTSLEWNGLISYAIRKKSAFVIQIIFYCWLVKIAGKSAHSVFLWCVNVVFWQMKDELTILLFEDVWNLPSRAMPVNSRN